VTGTAVYIETGKTRVFACALEWPGWCRSGKTADAALETLAEYAPRYRAVTRLARVRFPAGAEATFDVVERLTGRGATDFGVPSERASADHEPLTAAQAKRAAAIIAASWAYLDDVVAGAPARLKKGPRGGGRDRDAIAQHVVDAEDAYARKLGIREKDPAARRTALLGVLRRASDGQPLVDKGWPPRYAARRIAWHVLDHAWEIEDKSDA
jgi:hypothetical protein